MAKAVDVNWSEYFVKIQKVCPWSWVAWQKNAIDIVNWQSQVKDLNGFEARVYIVRGLNPRRLKKLCRDLDQGIYEWLWSYPGYGPMATPVFCLIQQDRARLEQIRCQYTR